MHTIRKYIEANGVRLYSELYLPEGKPPFPTVCICHGIPARIPDPTDRGYPILAETICKGGFAAMIFNFRGAGLSSGDFDVPGWLDDLNAVLEHLFNLPEIDQKQVHLLGFSAGAAASICVAAEDKRIKSVISCSSPDRFTIVNEANAAGVISGYREIGIIKDPAFPLSVKEWAARFSQVKPVDCISKISPRPVFIVQGDADDIVPVNRAYNLYKAAVEPKKLLILPGGTHRLRTDERAVTAIKDWLKAN